MFMKILFLTAILLTFEFVKAKESTQIVGASSKSFYLEVVPGELKTLKFETLTSKFFCQDRLILKSFESIHNYPSADDGKLVPVNVINIYVNKPVSECLKKDRERKLTAEYQTPKSKNMRHIYVTTDEDVVARY